MKNKVKIELMQNQLLTLGQAYVKMTQEIADLRKQLAEAQANLKDAIMYRDYNLGSFHKENKQLRECKKQLAEAQAEVESHFESGVEHIVDTQP